MEKLTTAQYLAYQPEHRPLALLPFEAELAQRGLVAVRNPRIPPAERKKLDHLADFVEVPYPESDEARISLGSIVTTETNNRTQNRHYIVGAAALHDTIVSPQDPSEMLHIVTPQMPIGRLLVGKVLHDTMHVAPIGNLKVVDITQTFRPSSEPTLAPLPELLDDPDETRVAA